MANVNTFAGIYNLPAQVISSGTETALLVPASGYPGYPSPTFTAGSGFPIQFIDTVAGSLANDGHPFVVRLAGKVTTGASSTLVVNLYQVPGAIVSAGTSATLSNDHVVVTNAASAAIATTSNNFLVEAQFMWDSVSQKLNGNVLFALIAGANVAPNSGTAGTGVVTTALTTVTAADLNFIPSFTFGTANAANSVTVAEFTLDRA